jgi:hypothetical protein
MGTRNFNSTDYRRNSRHSKSSGFKPPSSEALAPPTVEELTRAFDELVDALMAHRRRPRPYPQKIECYSLGQLVATSDATLVARDRVADPVGYPLYQGLKKIARLLAAEVSMDDLQRLVARHDQIDGRRVSVLDHAFDGSTSKDGALWVA